MRFNLSCLLNAFVCLVLATLFAMVTATLEMNLGPFCVPAFASAFVSFVAMGGSIFYMSRIR